MVYGHPHNTKFKDQLEVEFSITYIYIYVCVYVCVCVCIYINISIYARTNRCYNERGSRTNYVRSSVRHCLYIYNHYYVLSS